MMWKLTDGAGAIRTGRNTRAAIERRWMKNGGAQEGPGRGRRRGAVTDAPLAAPRARAGDIRVITPVFGRFAIKRFRSGTPPSGRIAGPSPGWSRRYGSGGSPSPAIRTVSRGTVGLFFFAGVIHPCTV